MSFSSCPDGWEEDAKALLRRRRQRRAKSRRTMSAAKPPSTPPAIPPTLLFEVCLASVGVDVAVLVARVAVLEPVGATLPRYVRRLSLSKPPRGVVKVAPPVPVPPMTSVTFGGTAYDVRLGTVYGIRSQLKARTFRARGLY